MGRRKRSSEEQERIPEELQAREHGRQRTIYRVGNSWVVPVPPWVRAIMNRKTGGQVYWHEHRPGEVVLSVQAVRTAGRPPGGAAARELARLARENAKLRRRLRARPIGVLGEQISQVMMQAIKVGLPIQGTLDETLALVRDMHARVPHRRRPRRARASEPPRSVEVVEGPDEYPSPDPSLAPAVVEEGAGTSGT